LGHGQGETDLSGEQLRAARAWEWDAPRRPGPSAQAPPAREDDDAVDHEDGLHMAPLPYRAAQCYLPFLEPPCFLPPLPFLPLLHLAFRTGFVS
jgi:hypothetical protein